MLRPLLIFTLLAFPAYSLTVERASIDAAIRARTFAAEVETVRNETIPDAKLRALTLTTARVVRLIDSNDDGGWMPREGDTVTIQQMGGEINGRGAFYSGYPRIAVHARYRVYLKRLEGSLFSIAGWEEGLVLLSPARNDLHSRAYTRNRIDGSNGAGVGPYLYWDYRYFPLPYLVSSTTFLGLPTFAAAIDASFQTWRNAPGTTVEFLSMGCSTSTANQNDGQNNVIFVISNWQYDPSIIAITQNFYIAGNAAKQGQILDSDILLNNVNHAFTTVNTPGAHDVQNIVTHEAGHVLGMGHETTPIDTTATMYAIASPNEFNKRTLHADDLLGIQSAYPGVGNKLGYNGTSCTVPENTTAGCAAVHTSERHPSVYLFILFFLGFNLWLGRKGLFSRPSFHSSL